MTVKIEKVIFTVTNLDEENAGVRVETFPPLPDNYDAMEETPAYALAAAIWEQLQLDFDGDVVEGPEMTLQ